MGAGFPLALQAWSQLRHSAGQTAGTVGGSYLIGAVLGGRVVLLHHNRQEVLTFGFGAGEIRIINRRNSASPNGAQPERRKIKVGFSNVNSASQPPVTYA